jgi:hypothetical protein
MSDGLEDAYMAVEQAYGQGDFATALNLATELLALVPAGREDLLDHRLHLMIGHIHGFGLGQPAQAAAAYALVLATEARRGPRRRRRTRPLRCPG